jgi:hypothetical protein
MNDISHTKFHTSNSKSALVVTTKPEVNSEFREAAMLFHILQRKKVTQRKFYILQIRVYVTTLEGINYSHFAPTSEIPAAICW